MKRPPMSEADLAAKVVSHLQENGWEVFHEVQPGGSWTDKRADIVATRESELVVVECKKVLSFEVIAQAMNWQANASGVYVAVPEAKRSDGRDMAWKILGLLGLGAFEVKSLWPIDEGHIAAVRERVSPTMRASFSPRLRDVLCEGHKTHAVAGSSGGGHFTRFKQTCDSLRRFAEEHPGTLFRRALAQIDHHYSSISSGVASLTKWVERGKVPGLRIEDGKVYPSEAA